jgi:hypothetical protein
MINGSWLNVVLPCRPRADAIFAGDFEKNQRAYPYARGREADDPLRLVQTRGRRRVSDCPICGGLVEVWHNRLFDVLRSTGATGWDSRPVELKCRDGSVRRDYSRLILEGREPRLINVPIVIKADFSNVDDPLRVRPTVKDIRNVRIPIPRYDLWMIEGTHAIGVTGRVAEALQAAGVVGMEFVPLVIMKPRKGSRSKRA